MYLKLRPNVAINTQPASNAKLADFYAAIGLSTREVAPAFTVLAPTEGHGPSPFGLYVVTWSPPPTGESQVCLQFETDAIDELHATLVTSGATIEFFGPDANAADKRTLWFRDPAGNLMNVVES